MLRSHPIPGTPDEQPPVVDTPYLEEIEAHGRLPSPIERAKSLLRYIGDDVARQGARPDGLPPDTPAIVGARNRSAAMLRVEQLRDKGIVSRDVQRYGEYDELDSTVENWYLYEQRKRGRTAGNYGFVALRFDNEELKVFLDTVGLMIEEAFLGPESRDMRNVARAGVIDNIMRVQIRGGAFVPADLTDENRGAYREDGYAKNPEKPVIYIREQEKFHKPRPTSPRTTARRSFGRPAMPEDSPANWSRLSGVRSMSESPARSGCARER